MLYLELMTTDGCHLCEHAIDILQAVLQPGDAEVDLVDIAYEDDLMERYATRIPVLRAPASGLELGWPFDAEQLRGYLVAARAA
ncbi:Thiol-disulfide isomerase [Marinobacterium lacunae]|uniref:Thiol-disulfide isomerase n=1 Tax=Marinobacterium lacunae TaxID=1232683 RepID=A0A081FW96_9GAMM|nr:glutaredoxin family protein [Marinobacterium lacunae]KEA62801.1 Thiol-disulfide isomerase [Marinobacterium lacunae]MBR9883838.1 glutaredoxin family protein [Oceanospirillales bacterium]